MKTLQEQIEVMQHYLDGGEVERFKETTSEWEKIKDPKFDWLNKDYRIKIPKKTVTIEKWLTHNKMYDTYTVLETSKIDVMQNSVIRKVKLLDSYDVEAALCD